MSTSRVGRVQLRLRVPSELASATAALRATAERTFVVQVLEELEGRLHATFGSQAVIRIRRVALGCQLEVNELPTNETAARLASDLAEQIARDIAALPPTERLRPRDERYALFENDEHAEAAYLADTADGRAEHWLHTARESAAQTWTDVAVRGPAALRELVRWLRRMERLEATLELAGAHVHDAVVAAVPEAAGVVALVRARAAAGRERARGEPRAHPHASSRHGAPFARDVDPAQPATAASRELANEIVADATDVPASQHVSAAGAIAVADTRSPGAEATGALLTDPSHSGEGIAIDTDAAGLFYLVGRVLEIELAERLWAAGVPEGAVLAAVGAAVIGTSNDPAPRWFGGGFAESLALPTVAGWAMTEVNEVVQHALGRRLVAVGVRMSPAELDGVLEQLARDVATPETGDGVTRRLVARSVAALAVIVCARLGERASLARLRDVCTRPGRLVLAPEELHVVMPHDAIDVDIRRAGLDHDPGDAPWLQRRVRIEFAGADVI